MNKKSVKKLSWARLFFSLSIFAATVYGVANNLSNHVGAVSVSGFKPWFAGYVDVTSKPTYAFEKKNFNGEVSDAVLAFIVADGDEPCTPTWGNWYTLDEAGSELDLDRRIARLQQQGGKIAISFGGLLNKELGLACEDSEALFNAYKSVIDRYHVTTVDFDLENESLRNPESAERRAEVVFNLQEAYKKDGKSLVVWLTLPVAPQGLTQEGTDAVAVFLKHKVDLAGVNLMTMDYGGSREEGMSMYEASRRALIEAHRQLGILYRQAGINIEDASLWKKMGATPMIGQNDVVSEVFTIEDATALNAFASERGVGRMSMWSSNRDIPCGGNYVDVKRVSDVCSGVTSPPGAFTNTLSLGFEGDLMQQATILTLDPEDTNPVVDDPSRSPYPIWNEGGIYQTGDKVVWRGNVYEAKWWTKGDFPDNPVLQTWETPWQLLGPVLPTDKPMEVLRLPENIFPAWNGHLVYEAGDRVLFGGAAFRAKWWNQGESPAASLSNQESSPWVPLSQEQIREILNQ